MKPQHATCDHASASDTGSRESRCVCGSLLARITAEGVELKCRRCKRIVVVPWSQSDDDEAQHRPREPRGVARGPRLSQ